MTLDKKTKAELTMMAQSRGIDTTDLTTKAKLIEALKDEPNLPDVTDVTPQADSQEQIDADEAAIFERLSAITDPVAQREEVLAIREARAALRARYDALRQ